MMDYLSTYKGILKWCSEYFCFTFSSQDLLWVYLCVSCIWKCFIKGNRALPSQLVEHETCKRQYEYKRKCNAENTGCWAGLTHMVFDRSVDPDVCHKPSFVHILRECAAFILHKVFNGMKSSSVCFGVWF